MYANTQGNWTYKNVRTAAILTNSYVAGTVLGLINSSLGTSSPTDINCNDYNQLILEVIYDDGSLTSCEIKVEYSDDNATFYQLTNQGVSSGTTTLSLAEYTFTATGNYVIEIPIKYRYIKVSAKGTGTVTSSSLAIVAKLGTV